MKRRNIVLVSSVLLTAGVVAALAAPPRGGRGDNWGEPGMPGMMNDGGSPGMGGRMGWFGRSRSITADEYDTRTRERFARLDKNSDGILDAAEIEAAIMQRASRGRSPGQGGMGERLLQRFGDKTGKITKDAFLTEAKRRFAQFDLNNDGKITDDDLPPMARGKGMLKANGPAVPGPRGRMLMALREADAKGDGIITLDSYLAAETKRFDGWDRNKDGVVDKADVDLMRKEMVDYQIKRFLHAYGADADGKVTKDQYYKVAKERFAQLDRKGEGKITLGEPGRGRQGMPGRGWFGGRPGPDGVSPEGGSNGMPRMPPASPKN